MSAPIADGAVGVGLADVSPTKGEGARVIPVPPPLLFAVPMGAALALHHLVPLGIGVPGTRVVGAALLAVGIGIAGAGAAAALRRHTTIVPHRAVSALVTDGIFRFTRNPMYAGLALAYAGGSLLAASWWPLILFPVVLLVVSRMVIAPEEQYLGRRFGARYDAYRSRVRRWL